ncbi:hypothetical protein N0V95_005454 [Ascochyta clinopodiicola]|nr:hypothetical protein N0V95_005454 [Ascochyta clinopodiicola]
MHRSRKAISIMGSGSDHLPEAAQEHIDLDLITLKNQTDSPLLRLPAELRNSIYTLVCDTVAVAKNVRPPVFRITGSGAALQFTCRQIRSEASLCATDPTTLRMLRYAYPGLIETKRCGTLHTIEMDDWSYSMIKYTADRDHASAGLRWHWADREMVLATFPSVRRVVLLEGVEWAYGIRGAALELLRAVFGKPELEVVFL